MDNPFNFFDKIFYINLDSRTDRREFMEEQFKKFNIDAERFSAISLTKEQIETMKDITKNNDCFICNEQVEKFKILPCCHKDMCINCTDNWFNRSVFCPFCKSDQRNFI